MRNIINLRDLGGYETKDGRMIPYHTFYRSGSLNRMNDDEKKEFIDLKIKFILDLRSKQESETYPDPIFDDVYYLRHSGVQSLGGDEIDFSPKGMRQTGEDGINQFHKLKNIYYCNMPFNNESFRVLIENVKNKNTPLVFHCASGKDRTGVAAIVLLALLGCDEEIIMKDYLYSNVILKDRIDNELEKSKDLIEKDPNIIKLLKMIEGVLDEIGLEVIDSIKKKYGTFERYFFEEYNLDEDDIKEIRDYYLIKNNNI